MKEITTTYKIILDGKVSEYTETREAYDIKDAHYQIMNHWFGVEKIEFIKDQEEKAMEKFEVIIKEFNERIVELMNDGWVLIPHTYSNGKYHENFIKGNKTRVLYMDHKWNEGYEIYYSDGEIKRQGKINMINWNSWDFDNKDNVKTTLTTYYEIDRNRGIYTKDKNLIKEIKKLRVSRYETNEATNKISISSDAAKRIALSYLNKQKGFKTFKLSDGILIDKNIYKEGVYYRIWAKGKSFILK